VGKRNAHTFQKGRAKTGGRKPGVRNKATLDIKAMCQDVGADMVTMLKDLAYNAEFEPTRIQAAKILLDRGYGLAVQPVEATVTHNIVYEPILDFGQPVEGHPADDEVPARISGPARNGATVGHNGRA
jgi:hypothetical protein